ncbi:MAG: glycosyltransferase family 39 protein [Deltaproteobacteria bacterium]|nr:glycosyltransferase family 39 protein [Deltaproteobacteria bacterium]
MSRARLESTADVAVIALVARLAVTIHAHAEPVWDGFYYDLGARRIAAGLGYSEDLVIAGAGGVERVVWQPWAHYPVGYSGFLALFYRVLGDGTMVAALANALTGAALAAIVHRLALRAFESERRALVAGLLVALHPGLVLYSGALMTEPLAATLTLLSVLLALEERVSAWIGAGVALGLATLVRPNAILMAPFLGLLAAGGRPFDELRRRASSTLVRTTSRAVVVGAVALATVAPWTWRNCRVMDACAFVSTNAGWNLVIGSAPGATGKFEFLVGNTPKGGPTCDEGGQVAQDRCWSRYGVATIRRDLGRWLSLVPAKLHYTLDAEWFPINYLREARPDLVSAATHVAIGKGLTAAQHALVFAAALAAIGWSRPHRTNRRAWVTQTALLLAVLALATRCLDPREPSVWPLAVIACVLPFVPLPGAPRRTGAELGVAALILTTLATHAIFFGEDRYHLVATPAFALLAAGIGRRAPDRHELHGSLRA